MSLKYNVSSSSGNYNGVTAGTAVAGSTVFMGRINSKVTSLSALVSVTAATSTITLAAKWQVSNDNTTWVDVAHEPQNPAAVVLATGTAAIVTKVIPAPAAVYGWAYARISTVVGVTTGGSSDLYSYGYSFRQA